MSQPSVSVSADLLRSLQEKAARACPAEHVERAGGWLLRQSASRAWWTATALPHAEAAPAELTRRVAAVEHFYARHGVPARFQITPGACPDGLDPLLAQRGYRRASPVSLRAARTTRVAEQEPNGALRLRVDDEPTSAWFDVWHTVQGQAGDRRAEWGVLDRVRQPSAYVSALLGDEVVAVGRVVVDDGWGGVFGMATLPHARGRRAAHGVLVALARWTATRDADHLYLQVTCDNSAALRLYDAAGFEQLCGYHYRMG